MAKVTFFSLLDVDREGSSDADQEAAAAALWPGDLVRSFVGEPAGGDGDERALVRYLQEALTFRSIRPGATPGRANSAGTQYSERVGLTAELDILNPPVRLPLVHQSMPDVAFYLENTETSPAQLYVTHGPTGGLDIVLQGIPLRIELPTGFITPAPDSTAGGGSDLADVRLTGPFDPNRPDSLEITLSSIAPSHLRVRANARMTSTGDLLFDTVVPISIGPCKLSEIPCKGLHDVQLVPSVVPTHVPREHLFSELPLEWLRHRLDFASTSNPSVITFRTVDLDPEWEPYRRLTEKLREGRAADDGTVPGDVEMDALDVVIEDVALPLRGFFLPLHGRLALRRRRVEGDDGGDRYNLETSPGRIRIAGTTFVIYRLLLQSSDLEGESPVAMEAAWVPDGEEPLDQRGALDFSFTEEPALLFGGVFPEQQDPPSFKFAGADISVGALRAGVILRGIANADFLDAAILLIDLRVATADTDEAVALRTKSGRPGYTILRDIGWRGGLSFPSLYDPDGLEFVLARSLRVYLDELALVSAHQTVYVSVSGGATIGGGDAEDGWGVRVGVRRLRIRTQRKSDAPLWSLDGLTLAFRRGPTEILGSGMLSNFERDGNRYHELGFEVLIKTATLNRAFEIGAQYLNGTVRGNQNFSYWLFGLRFGEIPLGSTALTGGRVLLVKNMAPLLEPPDGNAQPMRLFRWYKQNGDAISVPLDRKLGSWTPRDRSLAVGIGCGLQLAATKAVRLDGFFFYHDSPDERGLLGGLELYLLKGERPVAFVVYEHDFARDKWGLTAGLDLALDAVVGDELPEWLGDLARISGLVYLGNKPDTIAIGQYNDPSTWLTARLVHKFARGEVQLVLSACYHRIADPDPSDPTQERISVAAGLFSLRGGIKIESLASQIQFYLTLSYTCGQWRNEALSSGQVFSAEAGLRFRLFKCLNIGIHARVDLSWLGPAEVEFRRRSCVLRIETPWFLPDVTIRWERTYGSLRPERMPVISLPLTEGRAITPTTRRETAIGATAPAGLPAGRAVYELDQLRVATSPAPAPGDFAALSPVPIDSIIALDFKASVDAVATVLPPTPAGAGGQSSADLGVRYQIVEMGIRRRPRFGPGAGTWSDLIDPVTTRLEPLEDLPGDLEARFQSAVRFEWDADQTRVGRLDPRRLLINADTPYTVTSYNPEVDEDLASRGRWPCCSNEPWSALWHRIDFADTTAGGRTPTVEHFTQSRSTFRWLGGPPPLVVESPLASGTHAAHLSLGDHGERAIAIARFDRRAHTCRVWVYWAAQPTGLQLVIETYRGLRQLERIEYRLDSANPPQALTFSDPRGITSVIIRESYESIVDFAPRASAGRALRTRRERYENTVDLVAVEYRTVDDVTAELVDAARCEAHENAISGRGRLAWLPNHDYEVAVQTRLEVDHTTAGAQQGHVEQRAYFRTKGLPGLNATERIGEELEPYVDAQYPASGAHVYRREPIALAFREGFNILVPVDHTPNPADPAERQQLLEWTLAVDKLVGDKAETVSITSPDWVVAHRGAVAPLAPAVAVITDSVLQTVFRRAWTLDALRQRFDNMRLRPQACGTPGDGTYRSQVLLHAPTDPAQPPDAGRWAAAADYRVNARSKAGPYVARDRFEAADLTAFTPAAFSGAAPAWELDGGALRPVSAPTGTTVLALFGDTDWDHVSVTTTLDPETGTAGIALAVAGEPVVTQAVWAEVGGTPLRLKLMRRRDGLDHELAASDLPPDVATPLSLTVVSYDDRWRASVGDVVVEAERDDVRSGRLGLVARDGGRFTRLGVTSVDAYRFHFRSSRYDDLEAHIHSYPGAVADLRSGDFGTPTDTASSLWTTTAPEIATVMTPTARAEARERVFERWITTLGMPLRQSVDHLAVSRYVVGENAELLLLESPEPLTFSTDVQLLVQRRGAAPPDPDPVAAFVATLEIEGDLLLGGPLPAELETLRTIAWTAEEVGQPVERRYTVRPRRAGAVVEAVRVGGDTPATATGVRLLGPRDEELAPAFPLPQPQTYETVGTTILCNGDETRALVIPAVPTGPISPFSSVPHKMRVSIDRTRFRQSAPADQGAYRAQASVLLWASGTAPLAR